MPRKLKPKRKRKPAGRPACPDSPQEREAVFLRPLLDAAEALADDPTRLERAARFVEVLAASDVFLPPEEHERRRLADAALDGFLVAEGFSPELRDFLSLSVYLGAWVPLWPHAPDGFHVGPSAGAQGPNGLDGALGTIVVPPWATPDDVKRARTKLAAWARGPRVLEPLERNEAEALRIALGFLDAPNPPRTEHALAWRIHAETCSERTCPGKREKRSARLTSDLCGGRALRVRWLRDEDRRPALAPYWRRIAATRSER